jgi:DNA-binding NtrC family response regulator
VISDSVYVVDDAQAAQDVRSLALKKNYHVKAFPSAESAIEALAQIKRLYPEMIVIMMSAYDDEKIVVYALSLSAYDYLVKPLQMDILLEIIQNALWTTTT